YLRGPEAMAEGHQDHGRIPMTIAVTLRRRDQLLDFGRRQVFALAVIGIRPAASRNCSLFAGWCHQGEVRFRLHLSTAAADYFSHNMPNASSKQGERRGALRANAQRLDQADQ